MIGGLLGFVDAKFMSVPITHINAYAPPDFRKEQVVDGIIKAVDEITQKMTEYHISPESAAAAEDIAKAVERHQEQNAAASSSAGNESAAAAATPGIPEVQNSQH